MVTLRTFVLTILMAIAVYPAMGRQHTDSAYSKADIMPKPGYNLPKYLLENLNYPTIARKLQIQGKVLVRFMVNTDGKITNCEVIQGIGGNCDAEALRVVKRMPRWQPGIKDGVPVKVFYTLPINFSLAE